MVDALTVGNLGPLDVYPAINCYKLPVAYLQSPDTIDLGHGVGDALLRQLGLGGQGRNSQWVMLTWTWRIHARGTTYFQRLNVLTLDGQAGVAGFPVPTAPGTNDSVRTTFSDILRGVSTLQPRAPAAPSTGWSRSPASWSTTRRSAGDRDDSSSPVRVGGARPERAGLFDGSPTCRLW